MDINLSSGHLIWQSTALVVQNSHFMIVIFLEQLMLVTFNVKAKELEFD